MQGIPKEFSQSAPHRFFHRHKQPLRPAFRFDRQPPFSVRRGKGKNKLQPQLKQELSNGARYWFTAEEEQELQEHNRTFQRRNMTDEVLFSCFRPATEKDTKEIVHNLSAADIFKALKKQNPAAMRGVNPNSFAQLLSPAGFVRKRGRYGNVYPVVQLV